MGESNVHYTAVAAGRQTREPEHQQRSRRRKLSLLLTTFLISVVLAVGHATIYSWLNHKSVDTIPQQWVTNIGTAFAFAFKLFVTLTATTAFVQHQWRNLRGQSFKVREIDTMTDLINDPLAVFSGTLWLKTPMLILLASVVWLAPIAAIFSPGAIRVTNLVTEHREQVNVAELQLANNSNFAISNAIDTGYEYSDASPYVHSVALSTATSGRIASISHPFTNISYDLKFNGPAIKCFNSSEELTQVAAGNVYGNTGSGGGPFFLSFVYGDGGGYMNANSREDPSFNTLGNVEEGNYTATTGLYIITRQGRDDAHLFQCELYNASYDVAFDFHGGMQDINITTDLLNPVGTFGNAIPSEYCVPDPPPYTFPAMVYGNTSCMVGSTIVSYQAVMQAFNSLYVGGLYGSTQSWTYVRKMTLIEMISTAPDWQNLSTDVMQRQMESQFRNITVSLLAQPLFTQQSLNDTIPASVTTFSQVYEYQPFRLWIPYSIAIGAALLCVTIGARALTLNEASYTNHFSTYARITSQLHRDGILVAEDDASNPCPKQIKDYKVTVTLSERPIDMSGL